MREIKSFWEQDYITDVHEPQRRSYQNPIYDSVVYVVFSKGWFLEIKTYNQPLGGLEGFCVILKTCQRILFE